MAYREKLLDGFDLLYKQQDDGLKSAYDMQNFFGKLVKAEQGYAKSLLSIAKHSKAYKSADEEIGTIKGAWDSINEQLEKLASAHDELAKSVNAEVADEIGKWMKEKDKLRKQMLKDGKNLTKEMADAIAELNKKKEGFVKSSKDSDKAYADLQKVQSDPKATTATVQKFQSKCNKAADTAATTDDIYKSSLSQTNAKQNQFYTQEMPAMLDEFQKYEEERIEFLKSIFLKYLAAVKTLPTSTDAICAALEQSFTSVDKSHDIGEYVNANATGINVPADISYEPYESANPNVGSSNAGGAAAGGKIKIGTYKPPESRSSKSLTRSYGLSAGDDSLSLADKTTKLNADLSELDEKLISETKAREGIENLVKFYASDPGAQKKAQAEMNEADVKIQQIQQERDKVWQQMQSLGIADAGADQQYYGGGVQARGLYDYDASAEGELGFRTGDILNVTEQDDSGWWYCELNGAAGFVPSNYLELL